MNNKLKHIVQEMIDNGNTEEEISLEIKRLKNIDLATKDNKDSITKRFLESKFIVGLLELVLPTILSTLFTMYNDQKYENSDCYIDESISITFGVLFFFIVLIEWLRRYRSNKSKFIYEKHIYIGVLFFVFLLGIWYVNSICH